MAVSNSRFSYINSSSGGIVYLVDSSANMTFTKVIVDGVSNYNDGTFIKATTSKTSTQTDKSYIYIWDSYLTNMISVQLNAIF